MSVRGPIGPNKPALWMRYFTLAFLGRADTMLEIPSDVETSADIILVRYAASSSNEPEIDSLRTSFNKFSLRATARQLRLGSLWTRRRKIAAPIPADAPVITAH